MFYDISTKIKKLFDLGAPTIKDNFLQWVHKQFLHKSMAPAQNLGAMDNNNNKII